MAIDTTIEPGSPDMVMGAITWPKAWGRPDTPRLADGFSILIKGTDVQRTAPGGPVHNLPFTLTPAGREVDGGPDDYRVQFSQGHLKSVETINSDFYTAAQINLMTTYTIEISFNPDVKWTSGPPSAITPVRVEPKHLRFQRERNVMMTLPDFTLTDSLIQG